MDERLQQLWREFTADPTIENYERVALANARSGIPPRVVDIPARIFVADATGRRYACNLFDPKAMPADYIGNTMVDTNHRLFLRSHQLQAGTLPLIGYGGPRTLARFPKYGRQQLYTHQNWICFVDVYRP